MTDIYKYGSIKDLRLLAVTCFRLLGLTSAPLSLGDVPFCSTLSICGLP